MPLIHPDFDYDTTGAITDTGTGEPMPEIVESGCNCDQDYLCLNRSCVLRYWQFEEEFRQVGFRSRPMEMDLTEEEARFIWQGRPSMLAKYYAQQAEKGSGVSL